MSVEQELEIIRKKHGGFLRPQDVVDYARNPKTVLHSKFEWNDGKAAEKYRLSQAREIIRVAVIVHPVSKENVRAYVNLTDDRKDNNGYRAIVEVLNDEVLTDMLLQDALQELNIFRKKYEQLRSISGIGKVFDVIDDLSIIGNGIVAS